MKRERPALFKWRHFEAEIITIWRWVQRYAPELNRRCRHQLRNTNRSWRVDETYCRVAGKWTYLYWAVDSSGATIDFFLSAKRDCGCGQTVPAESFAFSRPSSTAGDQRRPESVISESHLGTARRGRARPALSLSTSAVLEQHGRSRS